MPFRVNPQSTLTTQFNHLASLAKYLSAHLRTKWLWVQVQLQSLEDYGLYVENMQKNLTYCLLTKRKNPECFGNFSSSRREKQGHCKIHSSQCLPKVSPWLAQKENFLRDLDR